MDIYHEQVRTAAKKKQNEENAARIGAAFGSMQSSGQGSIEWEEKIDFGMTFVQIPWVSCGHTFDTDEYRQDLDLKDDDDIPMPLVSNYVTVWERDENGFYTGAWVGARVHVPWIPNTVDSSGTLVPAVPADLELVVTHFFRFEAIAMKAVPGANSDASGSGA